MIKKIIFFLLVCGSVVFAKENVGVSTSGGGIGISGKGEVGDCNPATAQVDLNINNIRSRLLTGGDLWWDPVASQNHYQVPKDSDPATHSLFAGALWIGGIDQLGQLKVAAQTYRQTGNDFWPGPLDSDGQVEQEVCNQFDRFFEVRGNDITTFLATLEEAGGSVSPGDVPESILLWPGRNNPYFSSFELPEDKNLAPFWDADGDEDYDPTKGDYPVINPEVENVYADQMIWWVFNDRGNTHTETGGEAIGLEIGALAFAFATNDDVNNMTFYRYVIDNKSTQPLNNTYFGQWVDPDLGQYTDDFVGCVPEEALGIVYNGDAVDEGFYGATPPMLGVDFFEGPKRVLDVDEDGDGELDVEQLGMSAFVYYNNDFSVTGNPENASHIYQYLSGFWKDGLPFTFGGTGRGGSDATPYMFPDGPDQPAPAWSECAAGNTPADRRFLQSSGPFRLDPGAVNSITVGVVWIREGLQYPCPSFDAIIRADRKAQALFDNNFKLKDGPDAPNLSIRELNREVVLSIWNDPLRSNNAFEAYEEADPVLKAQGFPDSLFAFQGYKVYQLKDQAVSSSEYNDPDKARLVANMDIKDGIQDIINYLPDADVGGLLVPNLMVAGLDNGISHTLKITEDLFATGDTRLINNKRYYFSAVAYSYNAHTPYTPDVPESEGPQLEPYLEGRNNIQTYTAIPHIPTPQAGGVVLNAEYGEGPEVKSIEGQGNGGFNLELTENSVAEILSNGYMDEPVYQGANAPIEVKIFDPLSIPAAKFQLEITNADSANLVLSNASTWTLRNVTNGDVYMGEVPIGKANEQGIGGWDNSSLGFSINMQQQTLPGTGVDAVLSSSIEFKDVQDTWLSAIPDDENLSPFNWARSGDFDSDDDANYRDHRFNVNDYYDPDQFYESILDAQIAPYCLTTNRTFPFLISPACPDCTGDPASSFPTYNLDELSSVDIVLTNNKDHWTRCVVVESASDAAIAEGKASKNGIRRHPSWNKDGSYNTNAASSVSAGETYFVVGNSASAVRYQNDSGETVEVRGNNFFRPDDISGSVNLENVNGAEAFNSADLGRSWFPGYAINLETGERLNIMFGENSFFGSDNGADMIWNPTSTVFSAVGGANGFRVGGQHFVYIMNSRYDEGAAYQSKLIENAYLEGIEDPFFTAPKKEVYDEAMYTTIPLLTRGFSLASVEDGLVPSNVTIKLRVSRPYEQESASNSTLKYEFDLTNFAAKKADTDVAKSAMDLVKVVPNPYYAFSQYETSQLDNRVRITNLPSRANITVMMVNGTVIKQIRLDNRGLDTAAGAVSGSENVNFVDWDIKNNKGIPVSSGLYLIHVEAPDLGEEITLKWFCVARAIDLDVF